MTHFPPTLDARRGIRVAALALLSLSLVACASNSDRKEAPKPVGDVQARVVATKGVERYEESENVTYLPPVPATDNPAPAYPPELLSLRLPPTTVSVRIVVDESGVVTRVDPIDVAGTPAESAFLASIEDACRRWKFSPLIQGILDVEKQADGSIAILEAREKPLPFHLDYAFLFTQNDGQPTVSADKGDPRVGGGHK